MRVHSTWRQLVVCCAAVVAVTSSERLEAQALGVTGVWYEVTADREEQVEFYAYSRGRLFGQPGSLRGVLISSCPWVSGGGGFPPYCGDGHFYQEPFSEDQEFFADHPNYTNLGIAEKPLCSTGTFAYYNGRGKIFSCAHIFDSRCGDLEHTKWGTDQTAGCIDDEEEPPPGNDGPGEENPDDGNDGPYGGGDDSPILIDLDDGGFQLTSLEDGVWFDIDADGVREKVSWTQEGVGDAFLFLDRNGNGIVDDGSELFGNVTPQPASATPNGYLALAWFDDPGEGGNGDGILSAEDSIFWRLTLWVDHNHDGVSQPHELVDLEDAGIESVDLDYVTSARRDRWGNRFRYKSLVATPTRMLQSVDVFLLVEQGVRVTSAR